MYNNTTSNWFWTRRKCRSQVFYCKEKGPHLGGALFLYETVQCKSHGYIWCRLIILLVIIRDIGNYNCRVHIASISYLLTRFIDNKR
jgi:hypothetical protein